MDQEPDSFSTDPIEEPTESVEAEPPMRASGLAVLSMLCALGSAGGCCLTTLLVYTGVDAALLAMFGLPVLGMLAVTLGWIAVIRVKRADAPVVGKQAAIVGIFVGLICVVVQGSVATGMLLPWVAMRAQLVPVLQEWAWAAPRGETDMVRRSILQSTSDAVSDERLALVLEWIDTDAGPDAQAQLAISTPRRTRALVTSAQERGFLQGDPPSVHPKALEIVGARGSTVLLVFLNEDEIQRDLVRIEDMLVALDGWRCVTLLPDGIAGEYATYLGMERIAPPPPSQSEAAIPEE